MTTPPDHGYEPADLSEVTATDALLDRLGARNASADDLLDPAAAALDELLALIDQSREPDLDAARLIEVLAGRPLYITGADAVTDEVPLMIDLTAHDDSQLAGAQQVGRQSSATEDDDFSEIAASVAADPSQLLPPSRLPIPAAIPLRAPAEVIRPRRWDRVLGHATLPAASILLLIAVGGGVSAAVTGNPMAPVDGISRVMDQLPGVQDNNLDEVKAEINAARQAVFRRDTYAAAMHLRKARDGLSDVPDADKSELNEMIDAVAVMVSPPATVPTVGSPEVAVTEGPGSGSGAGSPTAPATAEPSPTTQPTQTAAPPEDPLPSSDPIPSDDTKTPDPEPTTEAPAPEATAAATAAAP